MLLGREAECAKVREVLETARGGRSAALIVRGEAGIGKTSLLEFAAQAGVGMRVLRANGIESESELPFSGLEQLIRPLLGALDHLAEPQAVALRRALALESTGEPAHRFATYLAVLGLLAFASEDSPTVCLVDDAQWLDADSADALRFVARRLEADAAALIFATRPGEDGFDAPGTAELALGPIASADALELLRAHAPGPIADDVAERLIAATAGNPLALAESARALTEDQLAGLVPIADPAPLGRSADRLFRRRIDALSHGARRSLLVAAVAGAEQLGPVLTASAELGCRPEDLEEAETAGLLTVAVNRLAFAHPLMRTAAYVSATPAERRAAHRALAGALDESAASWHLAVATLGPDERVAAMLEREAERARRRSGFAAAAAALDRAATLSEDREEAGRRRFLAAQAARLAGHGARAAALAQRAAEETTDSEIHTAIEQLRGRLELFDGRAHVAHRLLVAEADRLANIDPDRCASVLADAAFAAMLGEDERAAVTTAQRAFAMRPPQDAAAMVGIGLIRGTALFRAGQIEEGLRIVAETADRAETAVEQGLDPEYAVHAAHGLAWVGRYDRAAALLDRCEREARRSGALGVLPWILYVRSDLDTRTGSWAAAYAAASEAARIADDTRNSFLRAYALGCLAMLEAGLGREGECRRHATEATDLARQLGVERPRKVADALGLLELGLGRPREAVQQFARAGRVGTRLAIGDLVEAYVRAQLAVPDPVRAAIDQTPTVTPALRAMISRCRGLLAGDNDFEGLLLDALAGYDEARMPFGRARTALLLGERLRRAGRRVDSRVHLRDALTTFSDLGAAPWTHLAQQELRATGETVNRRASDEAEELTPQELRVATAVARGATNRDVGAELFLSPKTVEYHLGRVFRKLDVRSRTELAARLGGGRQQVGSALSPESRPVHTSSTPPV